MIKYVIMLKIWATKCIIWMLLDKILKFHSKCPSLARCKEGDIPYFTFPNVTCMTIVSFRWIKLVSTFLHCYSLSLQLRMPGNHISSASAGVILATVNARESTPKQWRHACHCTAWATTETSAWPRQTECWTAVTTDAPDNETNNLIQLMQCYARFV